MRLRLSGMVISLSKRHVRMPCSSMLAGKQSCFTYELFHDRMRGTRAVAAPVGSLQ